MSSSLTISHMIYGTAWKKERTADLVELAIKSGFRTIDTACQPKHYNEKGVGEGIARALAAGIVKREDLFLQTKYTSINGQDPRNIPYDKTSSLRDQVLQSFNKSLENLQTSYIDSLIMHSPMETLKDTLLVWKVFEEIHSTGQVKYLGLSNTYDLKTLQTVYEQAIVKPSFLQNRFYAQTGYDEVIRAFCRSNSIRYQSFWTLSANPHIIKSQEIQYLAKKYQKTPEQIFFNFVESLGILPLSGTTSAQHMQEDLLVNSFTMEKEEINLIQSLLF